MFPKPPPEATFCSMIARVRQKSGAAKEVPPATVRLLVSDWPGSAKRKLFAWQLET